MKKRGLIRVKNPGRKHNSGYLQFNATRLLREKGVGKPLAYLTKIGIAQSVAYTIISGNRESIRFADLERICTAINCTPNELFGWQAPEGTLPPNHELLKLIRSPELLDFLEKLKTLSPEKLEEVKRVIGG